MKNFLKSGLLVAVAVMSLASSSQAGVLGFSGTTTAGSSSPFASKAWSLALTYTANNSGPTAVVTAATLVIGSETFGLNTGFGSPQLALTPVAGTNNDTMSIQGFFNNSVPGAVGNGGFSFLNLTLTGTNDITGLAASDANVQLLGATIGNTVTGNFAFGTGLTAVLNGSVPAPEPGSIAVLCGLGLIVGRRVLKSRSSKKQEVAA
ncbi:MAG: hypothetical protein WCK86_11745 [Planctomycetia bacterium]